MDKSPFDAIGQITWTTKNIHIPFYEAGWLYVYDIQQVFLSEVVHQAAGITHYHK